MHVVSSVKFTRLVLAVQASAGQRTVGAFRAWRSDECSEFVPSCLTAGRPNTNDQGRPCHRGAVACLSESHSEAMSQ